MFLFNRHKKQKPTQSQVDYAKELYRIFNGRELRRSELTKEEVERIIAEYSNKLICGLAKNED